ncbi:Pkr1 protein [Saccharomycopsis crataegensis]|uniref:Pkr1 protein n=1 Tax=Saccharomycopsis crataegensis TaxID=43959 RepID=A0AAV5QUL7_9ASCO|nr:Pkr1 protein [Saccharomycopsis crataegensis]
MSELSSRKVQKSAEQNPVVEESEAQKENQQKDDGNKEKQETSKVFFVELWESIFTPGTTPALIKATHGSFIILMLVFLCLIFVSKPAVRFHFINLLLITMAFYAVVVWFVRELELAKQQEALEASKRE